MKNCLNLSIPQFKQAAIKLGEITVTKIVDTFPEDYTPSYEEIMEAYKGKSNIIDYNLKAVEILNSDKAKQVFEKGTKNKWDLNKILTELNIPKEQKQIILDKYKGKVSEQEFIKDFNIKPNNEKHPEDANTYDVIYKGNKIGIVALFEGKNKTIKGVKLQEQYRNKGLGKQLYKYLNYLANKNGGVLTSDPEQQSESARRLWNSLIKEGLVNRAKADEQVLKFNFTDLREEIITDLLANYSYSVEINTAKEKGQSILDQGRFDVREFIEAGGTIEDLESENPTQHYSNLTVPGGTNYTENAIQTPNIINSSIAHINDFAKGIANMLGWFRSDEQGVGGEQYTRSYWDSERNEEVFINDFDSTGIKPTKTRRILEVQSDLFQKGRDKENLISKKGKYYRVLNTNIGNNVTFQPNSYSEFFEQGGDGKWYPKMSKYGGYWKSNIAEISASKSIGAAVMGNWTASGMPKDSKFYIYELEDNVQPDYDVSHLEIGDFKQLQEVRYRKPVSGKLIGEFNLTPEIYNTFSENYDLMSEDGGINKHYELEDKFEKEYGYRPYDEKAPSDSVDKFNIIQDKFWKDTSLKVEKVLQNIHNKYDESFKQNQFLQLLNKDNNWVTFFVKSIIQDSAKKGYEKVLFPSGNTASKVEGHSTLEEFKKQKEDRIKELETASILKNKTVDGFYYIQRYLEDENGNEVLTWRKVSNENGREKTATNDEINQLKERFSDETKNEINQLKQELERVETEGFGALKPIYNFYENTVTNILNKTYGKDNVKTITDEYGNTWNEINVEDVNLNIALRSTALSKGAPAINVAKEAAWLKEKLGGNIDINIVNQLIQGRGMGAFKDASVYLFENAEEGTAYHEAFHAVFNMFLTASERAAIINEFKQSKNYKDRIEEVREAYPELNEAQLIEEVLAEDFREFVLAKGKTNFPTKKQNFFEKLYNFIKTLFFNENKNLLNELYENIEQGKYKTAAPISTFTDSFKFKKLNFKFNYEGKEHVFTEQDTKELLDGVNFAFFQILFRDGNADALFSGDKTFNEDLYKEVREVVKQKLFAKIVGLENELAVEKDPKMIKFIETELNYFTALTTELFNLDENYQDTENNENWKKLVEAHGKYLTTLNIVTEKNDGELDTLDADSTDEETSTGGKGAELGKAAIKFNTKNGMPKSIKMLIAGLPKLRASKSPDGKVIYAQELNTLGLPVLVNFDNTYAYLSDRLAGTSAEFELFDSKLSYLSTQRPELAYLRSRLNTQSKDPLKSGKLKAEFIQAFAKTKIEYQLGLIKDNGNITFIEANSSKLRNKIKDTWKASYRSITPATEQGDFIVTPNQIKKLQIALDSLRLPANIDKKPAILRDAYSSIGIDLSAGSILEGTKNGSLETILKDLIEYGAEVDLFTSKQVSTKVNQLAELEAKYSNEVVELQHINAEGETVYGISLNSYLSLTMNILNEFAGNPKEILARLPHLDNPYSKNSILLDRAFKGQKTNVFIIDGYKNDKPGESGVSTKDLKPGDKLSQNFNSTLQGIAPYLRAADRGTENALGIDELIVKNVTEAEQKFLLYLLDEIVSAKEFNLNGIGTDIAYYNSKEKLGLRIFEGILKTTSKEEIKKVLETEYDVQEFIVRNYANITDDINNYFKAQQKLIKDRLDDLGLTDIYYPKDSAGKPDTSKVYYQGINQIMLEDLFPEITTQEAKLAASVELFAVNSLTWNIEMTKVLTGDPAFYKSPVDFFKRIGSNNGTKKVSIVGQAMDTFMNTNLVRKDGKTENRDKIKTVIFEDVNVGSNYAIDTVREKDWLKVSGSTITYLDDEGNPTEPSALRKLFTEEFIKDKYKGDIAVKVDAYLKPYLSMDEGDAQGYVTLDEYRDILWRAGDWTSKHEVAYKKALNGEVLSLKDFQYFQPLKTQYMGYVVDKVVENLFAPTLYKHSLMPLIPSIVKDRKMKDLLDYMTSNRIGIAQFKSANKFGTIVDTKTKKTNSFYNKEGNINTTNLINQTIDYRFFGIQLDIAPKVKRKITATTQGRKLIMSNLFEDGKIAKGAEHLAEIVKEYIEIQTKLIDKEFNKVKEDLGVKRVDTSTGYEYKVESKNKLVKYLTRAASQRDVNDNVLDSIKQLLDENITIDTLLNKDKVENLLMAMIDSSVIKEKRPGGANIQGSSAGFESIDFKRNGKTSNYLKFYREGKDGQTLPMEVEKSLPEEWVGKINAKYGSLDSFNKLIAKDTELLELEGFNEATFAKLNVDIRLRMIIGFRIPNQGLNSTDAAIITRFLPTEAGDTIIVPTEMVAKAGSDFDIDKLNLYLPSYKMVDGEINYIPYTTGSEDKASMQNRMLELQVKIILDKYNRRQLLAPISDSIVKEAVRAIRTLKGVDPEGKADTYTNLIESMTNLDKFIYFLSGKAGVGQDAVHITNHTLAQQANLYVFNNGNDPNLFFDHNTVTIDGREYPSLAKIKDVNGNWISETLSAFLNAYVDIAKDPYIFDLNAGTSTANTIFYLLRLGADPIWTAKFMTQPIVLEYVKNQSKNESEFKKAKDKSVSQNDLISELLVKYNSSIAVNKLLYSTSKVNNAEGIKEISKSYRKVSEKELSNFIASNSKNSLSLQDKKDQVMLLDQFLEYQRQAVLFQEMVRASSPDTKGLGKNLNQLNSQIILKDKVREDKFIGNFDNLFNNSILTAFDNTVQESSKIMSNYYIVELPAFKSKIQALKTQAGLLQKDKEKVANMVDTDFINYILTQTKLDGKTLGVSLSDNMELFYGDKTLPQDILTIKRGTHPTLSGLLKENPIIKALVPIINKGFKQDNLKINSKKLTSYESNVLISSFNEIYDLNPELGDRIAKLSILQSGINKSPITFTEFIPSVKYFMMIKPAVEAIKNNTNLVNFEDFIKWFYLKNPNVIPTRRKVTIKDIYDYEIIKVGSKKGEYPYLKEAKKLQNGTWKTTVFTNSGTFGDVYYYKVTDEVIGDGMYLMGELDLKPNKKTFNPKFVEESDSIDAAGIASSEIEDDSEVMSGLVDEINEVPSETSRLLNNEVVEEKPCPTTKNNEL